MFNKKEKQHSWKQQCKLYSLYWTADSKVSIALCFTQLRRVPFSITSRVLELELWAQDLRSPERQFCPPSILPLQLLLSSDMDPLDSMGGKHLPDHVWNTSNSTSLPQCCNMLQHCENKICKKLTFIKTKKHILIHPTSMVAKSQLG